MVYTGEQIKARRKAKRISQTALAAAAGMAPSYLARVELGMIRDPRHSTLVKLSDALSRLEARREAERAAALEHHQCEGGED